MGWRSSLKRSAFSEGEKRKHGMGWISSLKTAAAGRGWAGDETPRAGDETPRAGDETPRAGDETSRAGGETSRGEDESSLLLQEFRSLGRSFDPCVGVSILL